MADTEGTKITEISESDVLADLAYIINGEQSGEITYTTANADGALRITAADAAGGSRTFELYVTELQDGR